MLSNNFASYWLYFENLKINGLRNICNFDIVLETVTVI